MIAEGTCERPGVTFEIRIHNLDYSGEENAEWGSEIHDQNMDMTPDNDYDGSEQVALADQDETDANFDPPSGTDFKDMVNEWDEDTGNQSDSESERKISQGYDDQRLQMMRVHHLTKQDESCDSSCDSVYFDAAEDLPSQNVSPNSSLGSHDTPPMSHEQALNVSDQSDDSALGFEMAPDTPKFYYHMAKIKHYVFGEEKVYELYMDGCMIQEHSKSPINYTEEKCSAAKKYD